jgi:hypothetical protein
MRTFLLGIALAGCAFGSNQAPRAGNGSNNMICRDEAPTGTSITRPVCRTPEQREADHKAAEDMIRYPNSQPGEKNR